LFRPVIPAHAASRRRFTLIARSCVGGAIQADCMVIITRERASFPPPRLRGGGGPRSGGGGSAPWRPSAPLGHLPHASHGGGT
jgi:hypothetical protein